ncbi:MAG: hypothetical protein KAJ03_06790 [Gammaproteobacteria bacterium]|nr:hypothetical protein [Gammaproteobacteria bacterium]
MPTPILQYTTAEAARAAIGMDEADMPDTLFVDQRMDDQLLSDIEQWLPTHAVIYSEGIPSGATDIQKQKRRWLELYSMWYCAYLASNLVMAMPALLSDGKDEVRRFANIDFEAVTAHASSQFAIYKELLAPAPAIDTTGAAGFIGVSAPTYDPVTGA